MVVLSGCWFSVSGYSNMDGAKRGEIAGKKALASGKYGSVPFVWDDYTERSSVLRRMSAQDLDSGTMRWLIGMFWSVPQDQAICSIPLYYGRLLLPSYSQ